MDIDVDKLLETALRDGIREGVKDKFRASYNNPLDALITATIQKHGEAFRNLLGDAVRSCIEDDQFRAEIVTAVRATLAKVLVQRFGGELEKQVNALKSDPATRARITLAIEGIVKERLPGS